MTSGWTATAVLDTSVQGVVVQTSSAAWPAQRAGGQREADVDRRVDDRLVALRQLVVGQAGAAARAVRRDAVVLDQQALVEDLLERPPDGLDVLRVHRPVGVVQVDPVAHPLGQLVERVDVCAVTDSRHLALNSAMPYASMSCLPVKPSSFSTASSTGRPWQSQPALRATW